VIILVNSHISEYCDIKNNYRRNVQSANSDSVKRRGRIGETFKRSIGEEFFRKTYGRLSVISVKLSIDEGFIRKTNGRLRVISVKLSITEESFDIPF
jgi:hypothetical protein